MKPPFYGGCRVVLPLRAGRRDLGRTLSNLTSNVFEKEIMVYEKPSVNRRGGTRQPFVQLMRLLRTAWIWIASAILTLLWTPLLGIIRLFDREPRQLRTEAGSVG